MRERVKERERESERAFPAATCYPFPFLRVNASKLLHSVNLNEL